MSGVYVVVVVGGFVQFVVVVVVVDVVEIECGELEKLFEAMYWDSSQQSIQKCLDYLDKDKNGAIGFDEFMKWGLYTWENQVLKPSTTSPGVGDLGLSPRIASSGLLERAGSRSENRENSFKRGSDNITFLDELNQGNSAALILEGVNEDSEDDKKE